MSIMSSYGSMIRVLLDSTSDEGTDRAGDSTQSLADGKFEFIGFIMWYIAMIFCCIIPTCCAYRRRRRLLRQMQSRRQSVELFLQRRPDVAAAEGIEPTAILGTSRGGNFFIPSHAFEAMYYARSNQVLALESLEGEAACGERRKRLETAMKNATFVVEEDDIINLEKSSHSKSAGTQKIESGKESGDDHDEGRQEGKDCCISDENG